MWTCLSHFMMLRYLLSSLVSWPVHGIYYKAPLVAKNENKWMGSEPVVKRERNKGSQNVQKLIDMVYGWPLIRFSAGDPSLRLKAVLIKLRPKIEDFTTKFVWSWRKIWKLVVFALQMQAKISLKFFARAPALLKYSVLAMELCVNLLVRL